MEAAVELTPDELRRIDLADAAAYERLYAVAAPSLGTGSRRIGETLAIWYPSEPEAGYNYLMNFHRAPDLDGAYEAGLEAIRTAGSTVFGVPVDERVAGWASPERLSALGLAFESDECIWVRRIGPADVDHLPEPTSGMTIARERPSAADLVSWIARGWDLPDGHTRAKLFACAVEIPEWKIWVAREGDAIAGVSILMDDVERVGYLLLTVVMPAFRGRGLQGSFIRLRLAEAARQGCTLAMTETDDDNASPRNMRRAGFRLCVRRRVYARSV